MIYDSSKVFLEVRKQMSDNETLLLKTSRLGEFANAEVWTAYGTNMQLAYSTHGLFRYFGKFPPPIATYLIDNYAKEKSIIFDPMCGSGTSGVESVLHGKECILNDVNDLSRLLSKVKVTHIDIKKIDLEFNKIKNNYKPLSEKEYGFTPSFLKNYKHWFLDETVESLRGIKYLIEKIDDVDIKNYFTICLMSIIRRVSRATTQQGRLFLDVETAEKETLPFFIKKVEATKSAINELPINNKVTIYNYDLRNELPDKIKSDLIICHPPYFNSYKYSTINSLELAWLGIDYSQIRNNEIKEFFKMGKEENSKKYISDMISVLKNLYDSLNKNGILALMIGDTIMHGNYVSVVYDIIDNVKEFFNVEKVVLRAPKYTEASWAASQRRHSNKIGINLYDFIIILRKKKYE